MGDRTELGNQPTRGVQALVPDSDCGPSESVLQYFGLRDIRSRESVHKLANQQWHHVHAKLINSLHALRRRRKFEAIP